MPPNSFEQTATFPACRSDACRQGRAACPTPDACRLPETRRVDRLLAWAWGLYIASVLVGIAAWVYVLSTPHQ